MCSPAPPASVSPDLIGAGLHINQYYVQHVFSQLQHMADSHAIMNACGAGALAGDGGRRWVCVIQWDRYY